MHGLTPAWGKHPIHFLGPAITLFDPRSRSDGADHLFMTDGTDHGLFAESFFKTFLAGPGSCMARRGPRPQEEQKRSGWMNNPNPNALQPHRKEQHEQLNETKLDIVQSFGVRAPDSFREVGMFSYC